MSPCPRAVLCAAAALLGGLAAAVGGGLPTLAALTVFALVALGAALPLAATRAVLLLALLLTPEVATGRTFGLDVHWSAGLTLPNFLLPALALPLLGGAWLAGQPVLPRPWPRLATGVLALLGWGVLTLLPPWFSGELGGAAGATVLAHVVKLALFVVLGLALGSGDSGWLLLAAVAIEAAMGLAQAAGWLPVFSPLAAGGGVVRATGSFYDANMYAVLVAWALLWLLSQPAGGRALRRWGGALLVLALAADLALASSRAGFLALAAGMLLLLAGGAVQPVARAALLLALCAALFPARTAQRLRSAAVTLQAAWRAPVVAPAAAAESSTRSRLDSMAEALRQIGAHPLLGLGFGRALYLGVAPRAAGPVRPPEARRFRGAQDMPLTVLAETGPIGLALFLWAFAAPLRRLRRARRDGRLPLLAGYAGLLAASLTLEVLWNARLLALVVMLTAGLAIGASPPLPAAPTPEAV